MGDFTLYPNMIERQPNPNFIPPPSKFKDSENKKIHYQDDKCWINVKNRLPNINEMCLLYTPCDGFMHIGFYVGNNNWQKRHKWKTITSMRATQCLTKLVTHWMPLPEPPKGE